MWCGFGYQDFDSAGTNRIFLARSQDGGQTFTSIPSVGPGLFAHLGCDGNGAVGVVWEHFEGKDSLDGSSKKVGLALSLDGGEGFDGPHAMPGAAEATQRVFPSLAVGDNALDVSFVDKPTTSWMYASATWR